MLRARTSLSGCLFAAAVLWATTAAGAKWQKLNNCQLVTDKYMDGDSFHVRHGNKDYIFRLYFVDSPETDRNLTDRIAEQAAYWNITDMRVIRLGKRAGQFTARALKPGFTVYTQWEDAGGASDQPRFFGVVKIGNDDLAEMLVEEGLARVYGATTPLPDGTSIDTFFQRLRQLESRAKSRKIGGWTDADTEIALEEDEEAAATEEAPEEPPAVVWPNVPVVAFLRAEAYINTERFEEAEDEMRALLRRFPDHVQKPRIEFYLALSIAMQERFEESSQLFRDWLARYPNDIMAPEVRYWLPISLFYGGEYAEALPLFTDYVKNYPMSVYAPEAGYRAALCRYSIEDFEGASRDLNAWVAANPDHYFIWEALVTLGDSFAALGDLQRAKETYLRVGKDAGAFYYMALTQASKVFKALGTPEDFREMADAYARFITDNPQSDNIIDAAYQAGWALRKIERQEDARKLYWNMIERYGNTPSWEGFDSMLKDLGGLYGDSAVPFADDLRAKQQKAVDDKRPTLASRLVLAETQPLTPEEQWLAAQNFAVRFKREDLGPDALVWLGETFIQNGKRADGIACMELLLSKFPESRYAAQAHVRLAEGKLAGNDFAAGLEHADAAIGTAYEPQLLMEATFLRARALKGLERYSEAVTDFSTILANRAAPRALKPEALLEIGACLEAQGRPKHAIPYYQRVYVLYGAYSSAVARAYLRSGIAFEELKDTEAAIKTYREMLELEAVAGTAEAGEAKKRLAQLGQI